MIRTLSFIAIIVFLASFQSTKLVKTKVNDSITISLPEEFTAMTQTELNTKYVSAKAPVAVYTDYSKTIDLGVNVAYSQWNPEDLEIMMSFYKSNIMGLYDEVHFLTENVQEINGRKFAVFEFLSKVNDTEGTTIDQSSISKFIRIQYTIVQGKTVLLNFSCPERLKDKWAPLAREILETVKISKTL